MKFCAQNHVAPYYGNGSTEGICSSIIPLLPLFSLLNSSDDEVGQSTGENECKSHSADASASILGTIPKYPSNKRKKTEIQMNKGNRHVIIGISRTD